MTSDDFDLFRKAWSPKDLLLRFPPMRALWLVSLVGMGTCSSSPRPTPAPVPSVVVAVASAPTAPQKEAFAPPPPPAVSEIREPSDVACRIAAENWRGDRLRISADADAFGSALAPHATLVLPVTDHPQASIVVMDDERVLVRAVLATRDTGLYAAKPTTLLGIVTPIATTDLKWRSSSPGAVRIGVDTSRVLRAPNPFETEMRCVELAIVQGSYDARASITPKSRLPKRNVVHDGAPIAASAGGAPVAELNAGIDVEVLESRGTSVRILTESGDYVLSGWVAQSDLGLPKGVGIGQAVGSGRGHLGGRYDSKRIRCPRPIALYVEVRGARTKVGLVHANTGFVRASEPDDTAAFRAIELPESQWLVLNANVRLVVEASELSSCRTS